MALSKKLVYRGATIPFALIGIAGLMEIIFPEIPTKMLSQLGYPSYVVYILGTAKFLGGLAIVFGNRFPKLKEWAYAGYAFDLGGAMISHLVLSNYAQAFSASILLLFTFYSRIIWLDFTSQSSAVEQKSNPT
ncbi:MAG: DoxX family protein [Leptolyngbya sp.]|nr:DoxX family protein [Candidatus Melainabacteria bacterium]